MNPLFNPGFSLIFRQQLHRADNRKLAELLDSNTWPAVFNKYDVFVYELCEANISKEGEHGLAGDTLSLSESITICNQLFEGLIQLENSNSCHNDLKPDNILFNLDQNGEFKIKISDFNQAGRTGGTPGWTWPKFLTERRPGRSDTYSVALLVLYIMSDNRDVFYRIRSNYVKKGQRWLADFRNDPFFKLIIDMMNLEITPEEAKDRWDQISGQVQIITKDYLRWTFGVDELSLRVQDGMEFAEINFAGLTLLDR